MGSELRTSAFTVRWACTKARSTTKTRAACTCSTSPKVTHGSSSANSRRPKTSLPCTLLATSRSTGLSVGRSGSAAAPVSRLFKWNPALDSEPTTSPSSLHLVYSCEQPNKASLGRAETRVVVRKPCPFSLSPQARGIHLQHAFQSTMQTSTFDLKPTDPCTRTYFKSRRSQRPFGVLHEQRSSYQSVWLSQRLNSREHAVTMIRGLGM
eukprot:COSAG06_NODE_1722_length_8587_cov_13.694156_5_plen_209_part_00